LKKIHQTGLPASGEFLVTHLQPEASKNLPAIHIVSAGVPL
jgi:hypothetical protein